MGKQMVWLAVIVACQLSTVYARSTVHTISADSTNSTADPADVLNKIRMLQLSGVTVMNYDPYDDYKRQIDTVNKFLVWYLIGVGVFVVGSLILGVILIFVMRPKPKQGFVVNSNGQQSQGAPVAQPMSAGYPGQNQGFVVNSNAVVQQSQNVAQNPNYQPMYPEVKSVQN